MVGVMSVGGVPPVGGSTAAASAVVALVVAIHLLLSHRAARDARTATVTAVTGHRFGRNEAGNRLCSSQVKRSGPVSKIRCVSNKYRYHFVTNIDSSSPALICKDL